jgi:hypothetical protein
MNNYVPFDIYRIQDFFKNLINNLPNLHSLFSVNRKAKKHNVEINKINP